MFRVSRRNSGSDDLEFIRQASAYLQDRNLLLDCDGSEPLLSPCASASVGKSETEVEPTGLREAKRATWHGVGRSVLTHEQKQSLLSLLRVPSSADGRIAANSSMSSALVVQADTT